MAADKSFPSPPSPAGTCHRTIAAHSEAVTGVDCNRDGSILASCSYDGLIRLWDASTGQCLKTLVHGEAQPIGHVSFSPNGFQLLATSLDGTVRLWDMANTRVLKTYTGHQNAKFALKAAFTAWQSGPVPAGESNSNARRVDRSSTNAVDAAQPPCMVAVGSEDHRVYLWDLQTKTVTQMLLGHRDAVICIAVRVASGKKGLDSWSHCRVATPANVAIGLSTHAQTHERIPIIASASLDRDPCIKVSTESSCNCNSRVQKSSTRRADRTPFNANERAGLESRPKPCAVKTSIRIAVTSRRESAQPG